MREIAIRVLFVIPVDRLEVPDVQRALRCPTVASRRPLVDPRA
jgi:hypothetical protein